MNALVLYDSKFGNTEKIAEEIALALQEEMPTRLTAVADVTECAEALAGVSLLVIGGPTHRHGVSSALRATLECLEGHALDGTRVAAFDTKLHGPRLVTGSAAVRLAHLMRRRGAWVVVPPASFLVEGGEGPLEAGEVEHARAWARELLQAAGVRPHALV
ncbi:MAG: flavodoxin family protein [Gaiellaceae bacterium]